MSKPVAAIHIELRNSLHISARYNTINSYIDTSCIPQMIGALYLYFFKNTLRRNTVLMKERSGAASSSAIRASCHVLKICLAESLCIWPCSASLVSDPFVSS
jgi:hypothetical protein